MNTKKLLAVFTAAVAVCLAVALPVSANAQTPIDATNDYTYTDNNYLYIDEDSIYIYIPVGVDSMQETLTAHNSRGNAFTNWSSSNNDVATVDRNGIVTAYKSGTAVITAKSFNYSDTCTVTVYKEKASALNKSSATLTLTYNNMHPTMSLYLSEVADFDGIRQWYSSNPSVASVDANGVVTAQATGSATICATTYRGNTLTCDVTVNSDVGKVAIYRNGSNVEGYHLRMYDLGSTTTLTAQVAVADPSTVSVTWSSSNPAAATVDANGVVTAVSDGETTITATASTGYSASYRILTGSVALQEKQQQEEHESSLLYQLFGD